MSIRDLTDADLQKINAKLKNAGSEITLNPKLAKSINEILPKGIKIELDPALKALSNDALAKAAEGKVMRVEVMPLLTHLRKALKDATVASPPEIEVGIQGSKLRNLITNVLNRQGFMINISTINDNYTKVIQQRLNGQTYTVKIHADAREIARSVQASLMNVQSRTFGLQVSRDVLRNSIDTALMGKPFNIQIAVMHDQARRAVQNALNNARMVGKDDALAYQRLKTGELKAAQAELARLKAAHMGAADAAKAHASASVNLGGAMGSNIRIAGELGAAMASLYSVHALKEFLSQVIEIGGELEHQKIAMDTIFGDKGKTNELFGQIKGLARQSPFGVMELTSSVKRLSAYGVEYNEIYDTAKRLADISAATSVDINRLILAFGKTKSRGFLDGLEAKQFAYANIPIYEMVRKKLEELEGQAVTTADVMARMKKREISFDIVKDVLWDITDEGGKFYNMQEALAGSVKTSWKLVRDNIELMFGEIAESGVGRGLKDVAEILQTLTRSWQAMGVVITAAATTFGIYKVAVLASNVMMGKANMANLRQAASQTKLDASLLKTAMSYRTLTAEEHLRLFSSKALQKVTSNNIFLNKALTSSEVRQLVASKALTKDSAARLIAMGRISPMQARYLVKQGLITMADLRAAVAARKHGLSIKILGKEITIASFRFKMLGAAILSSVKALGAMVWKSLPLAAISGAVYLWQKNSEEMEKAKEIGDNVFTKATEGADNLKQKLAEIKPSEGLSDHELKQGIEQMETAIKDYSPTPIKDINDALYRQDGLLRPLVERYDELKRKVEELKKSFDEIEKRDMGGVMQNAINDSGGSNWFTSIFNEDVNTNAKDYADSVKKQSDNIRQYLIENAKAARTAVKEAIEGSVDFEIKTFGMNTQQAFTELVKNWDKYKNDFEISSKVSIAVAAADDGASKDIAADKKTLLGDLQEVWESIETDAAQNGITSIKNASDTVKEGYAIMLKEWIQTLPQDAQSLAYAFFSGLMNFDFETFDAQGTIINGLNDGLEAEIGKALFQKVKNGIKFTPDEQAQIEKAVEKLYTDIYKKTPDAQKAALNKAVASEDGKGGWVFDSGKIMRIVARMSVRADWDEWQREIDDATGNLKPIQTWVKGATDIPSFIKAAQEGYADAQKTIDKFKGLKLSASIGFDFKELKAIPLVSKQFADASPLAKKMIVEWNNAVDTIKAAQTAGKELGFDPAGSDKKKNSGSKKGTQKDKVAEDLKQRFKDIKDAWSEFQKWSKTEGKQAAATRIGESGLFSTLPKDKIPQTVEQYRALVADLEKELRAAGVKGSARESLLNELLKQLLDIDKTVVDEQLKLALDKVTKEAERQLENWNLYDKVRKATGNKQLAMNLAFGMNTEGETDYVQMIKSHFNAIAKAEKSILTYDTATPELLAAAPEEVRKAWEKANDDILKYFDQQRVEAADLYNEYQTLADKITAINGKRQRALEALNGQHKDKNGNMVDNVPDPNERNRMAALINSSADWEIYRQGEDYLKFFSQIYSLALTDVRRIGETIKMYLNEQFQQEKLNIKEYADEIRKVNEQIRKAEHPRSNFLLGITSGKKGILDRRIEKEEGDVIGSAEYKNAINAQIAAHTKLNNLKQAGVKESAEEYKKAAATADETDKTVNNLTAGVDRLRDQKAQLEDIESIFAYINKQSQGLGDIFNDFKTISGAMGLNTDTDGFDSAEALINTMMAVSSGLQKFNEAYNSNDYAGMAAAVSGIAAAAAENDEWKSDSKKSRKIKEATAEFKALQAIIDGINRRMEHFLGNGKGVMTDAIQKDIEALETLKAGTEEYERILKRVNAYNEGGAYAYQMQLMEEQLNSLQKQYDAENEKKEKDKEALADMENQMAELRDQILYFAEGVANDLYGIDLKGWASELGDALFEAWKRGEDGAEAFKRKAGDVIGQVMNNVLKIGMLEPMMQSVSDYLFGTEEERKANNGRAGAFGTDFELQPDEINNLAGMIMKGMEGVDAYNSALDQLEKILNEKYGLSMKDAESKSGLSAGIQSVTEDTADLLASYINGIRGDVSTQTHEYWPKLIELMPQMSVISQAQLDCQRRIAENTLRNAVAAEAIMKSNNEISRLLVRVTQGGAKFCVQ